MDEQVEKLIVSLMVLIQEKGGVCQLNADVFQDMYNQRHQKGIQVQEVGNETIILKLGDMTVSPDEAEMN